MASAAAQAIPLPPPSTIMECSIAKFAMTDPAARRGLPPAWRRFHVRFVEVPGKPPAELLVEGGPNPGAYDAHGDGRYGARGRAGYLMLAPDGSFSAAFSPSPDMGPQVVAYTGACASGEQMAPPEATSPSIMPIEAPFRRHKMAPFLRD